jgi:hypothetical protein
MRGDRVWYCRNKLRVNFKVPQLKSELPRLKVPIQFSFEELPIKAATS